MKHEYCAKVLKEKVMVKDAEAMLNEMGADGWEMTGVIDQTRHNMEGFDTKVFYFKRETT